MPPDAEMDTEPLFSPKQLALVDETVAIVGDAWLVIVVEVVKVHPLASITVTL